MRTLAVAAGACLIALCVPVFASNMPKQMPVEEFLAVSDKPYIELAESAIEEAESYEQEPVEEVYYEPVYYTNNYWYESDDADAEAAAKEWIAQRESGGDYNATNGRYIGRYQLDSSYLDGDYSEENQEATAEAYVADRYGSWQAAQEHHESHGWY